MTKILVIDDDKFMGLLMGEFLKLRGYEVLIVTNGAEGMEIIKSQGVDLVISDINMPGMGGLDVLEFIQRNNPDLPVIMMTGGASSGERQKALKLGARGILGKPLDFSEVTKQIEKALN